VTLTQADNHPLVIRLIVHDVVGRQVEIKIAGVSRRYATAAMISVMALLSDLIGVEIST
jgi:hypothetical protein